MIEYFPIVESFILIYFIGLNSVYLMLNILSISGIARYMQSRDVAGLPHLFSGFAPPVTIIVPAYNEEEHILNTLRSLFQHNYPEYEIVVVNDGSSDRTLDIMKKEYSLVPFPEAYRNRIPSKHVRAVYHSTIDPRLRVIDKENGGRGDAVNAGINIARYPWFCRVDADSILQKDSLLLIVQPLLEDPTVVACGGTVRVANGCKSKDGIFIEADLSRKPLVLFQIVEYLRAFLYGRMGWSPMNAHLIISGAFGIYHKETVVAVGGYRSDTVGEDMELVVRLHRILSKQKKPYHITFVPEPICWTEVPDTRKKLKRQRITWQIGLIESLMMNRGLLFHDQGTFAGWLAFPFALFFEWMGPIVETLGYIIIIVGFIVGFISMKAFITFLILAIGFGVLLSTSALLLEEMSFHLYKKPWHIITLFASSIVENFGYRQLNTLWRVIAIFYYFRDKAREKIARRNRKRLA
jgi:cellulose synthase/poly-beta-1,6-N-acetylglucosamine synthase-like glycosyltransferase